MKWSKFEGRNVILMWKWTLEYLDRSWNHVETKGQLQQQRENGHSKYGAFSVYETEKPNSVGDATTEEITEIRQGYRGHGDNVRSAWQQR